MNRVDNIRAIGARAGVAAGFLLWSYRKPGVIRVRQRTSRNVTGKRGCHHLGDHYPPRASTGFDFRAINTSPGVWALPPYFLT